MSGWLDLELDDDDCSVTQNGVTIPLTPRQYQYFKALWLRKGRAISRSSFLDIVYNQQDEPMEKTIDVIIMNLRRSIRPLKVWINSRQGVGYYMSHENKLRVRKSKHDVAQAQSS